jgi:tRNA threonylcarbamoyladenosine biosynthesis protein TsaE
MHEKKRHVNGIPALPNGIDKTDEIGKNTDMEETEHITHSAEETRALGATLIRGILPGSILALRGDLGAGKTTFVQGLLEELGAEKPYVSPTFVIMKQYDFPESSGNGIRRIYHVDAYRIDDPADMEKLGFDEWCADPEGFVLVEWPEKIDTLLPENTKTVSLRWLSDTDREISFG